MQKKAVLLLLVLVLRGQLGFGVASQIKLPYATRITKELKKYALLVLEARARHLSEILYATRSSQ